MEFLLFAYITVVENFELLYINMGFPDSSAGKESTCNAGDLHLIPGLGRSLEEGKGYPLQYSGLENPVKSRGQRSLSMGSLQRVRHD